jgi:hypothetical protein
MDEQMRLVGTGTGIILHRYLNGTRLLSLSDNQIEHP